MGQPRGQHAGVAAAPWCRMARVPDTPVRSVPNPGGHAASLEPLRADNTYRGEHGAYSRDGRMLAPRAREIAAQLMGAPHVVGLDAVAAEEIGALVALVEALDAALARRGVTGRGTRSLLDYRLRASARLELSLIHI